MHFLLREADVHIIQTHIDICVGRFRLLDFHGELNLLHLLVKVCRGGILVPRCVLKLTVLVLADCYELGGKTPLQFRLHFPCVYADPH